MNEKELIAELIELYGEVVSGTSEYSGLLDHCDPYYRVCWDKELKRIQKIRSKLGYKYIENA